MSTVQRRAEPWVTGSPRPNAAVLAAGSAASVSRAEIGVWRILALVASDAVALLASGLASCAVATGTIPFSHPLCTRIVALVPLFTIAYGIGGLYPGFGVSAIQLLRTLSLQTLLVFIVIAGTATAWLGSEHPVRLFALWCATSLICVPLLRMRVATLAAGWVWWRIPVILHGTPQDVPGVIASLAEARHLGYRPVAVALSSPAVHADSATWQHLPVITEAEAIGMARALRVRTILLAGGARPEQKAAQLRHHFRQVILVNPLDSPLIEPTAVRYLGTAIGIEYRNGLLMRRNRTVKRVIDVLAGVAGLILFLPLALLGAATVAIRNPGPWWHAQWREGRRGVPFRMWKLRTMYPDADARLAQYLETHPDARAEWDAQFKLAQDPRVIPGVGRLLRRWSLDEYPQFWNVIRGEMSLVGPRPLPPYHLEAFGAEFRELRRHVRPGITGLWQVMSRGRGGTRAQEALERYYVYNWSIWMDLFILARTTLAVLSGRGAR